MTAAAGDNGGTPSRRNPGLSPLSPTAAVILVGGLRELTAQTVEDGAPVSGIVEPAVAAATALLGAAAVPHR
jgi:hypothetical protein